jgi:hypothetical protein
LKCPKKRFQKSRALAFVLFLGVSGNATMRQSCVAGYVKRERNYKIAGTGQGNFA